MDHYKTVCSSGTLYSRKSGFLYKFIETARKKVKTSCKPNQIISNQLDEAVINVLNVKCLKISSFIHEFDSVLHIYKDAISSKKKRLYCLRNEATRGARILDTINEAVLDAPDIGHCKSIDDGYSLPLALAVRANILMRNKEYMEAYKDLKNLILLNVPFFKMENILSKVVLCQKGVANISFNYFKNNFVKESMKLNCSILKKPRQSSSLKIRASLENGIEAIARRSIHPGETIIAEMPVASCLLPTFYKTHCHVCLKRFRISYACLNCSAVGFCSHFCKSEALTGFHKYECKLLKLFIGSGLTSLVHLAFRIITQQNISTWENIYDDLMKDNRNNQYIELLQIYMLENHQISRESTEYLDRAITATFLVQCLTYVGYFDNGLRSACDVDMQKAKIGTLLFTNLNFLQFNAHEIYEMTSVITAKFSYQQLPISIGIGIYPTAARFNHQCYSGTIRYYSGNMIVLKTSRLLQRNDAIAENYGPVFMKKSKNERQQFLASRYWFDCKCPACVNDWPILQQLDVNRISIRCPSRLCQKFIYVHLDSDNKIYKCTECDEFHHFSQQHQNILKKCIIHYARGVTIYDKRRGPEAANHLLLGLKNFHYIATPPYRYTHLAEIALQCSFMKSN